MGGTEVWRNLARRLANHREGMDYRILMQAAGKERRFVQIRHEAYRVARRKCHVEDQRRVVLGHFLGGVDLFGFTENAPAADGIAA